MDSADGLSPIVFGKVYLMKGDNIVVETEPDFDGFYSITEIDPGHYTLLFQATGYSSNKYLALGYHLTMTIFSIHL